MVKRKKSRSSSKPIGFIKKGKTFRLVFGTKTKPRVGKKMFRNKKSLVAEARKKLGRK